MRSTGLFVDSEVQILAQGALAPNLDALYILPVYDAKWEGKTVLEVNLIKKGFHGL